MRFQVPQFIEVEDKIFGPLTFKQFIYLSGAGGITVAAFSFLPKFFAFLISAPIVVLGLALAFYKINNRPFIFMVESFFKYFSKERLYIWKKTDKKPIKTKDGEVANPMVYIPKLSNSKLKDLSWELGVKKTGLQDEGEIGEENNK
jgi:hypothetical protein